MGSYCSDCECDPTTKRNIEFWKGAPFSRMEFGVYWEWDHDGANPGRISCGRQEMLPEDFCVWSQACWLTAVVLKIRGMRITTSLLSFWAKNEFQAILGYRVRPCCSKTNKQRKRKESQMEKSKHTVILTFRKYSGSTLKTAQWERTAMQEYKEEQMARGQGISQGVLLQCGKVVRQHWLLFPEDCSSTSLINFL